MSDAQLACLAVAAAPLIVGALWALGDLAGHVTAHQPAPSSARVARLTVGVPVFAALWLFGVLAQALEDLGAILTDLIGLVVDQAERAVLRVRDWMDV